ncbi:hypothetical protein BXY85_3535 [Roseivirga pacifica]|uniref:Peptidase S74 domain-containing protein n=1 Tax=Roseivirga pacifica TaxID=1267423 RepID=A0A1I0QH35_9BACT|nr:hypothetical protein [Roseivirga pacifica]RKQ42917.1 hypothetical protein BXY85_3535 [Roseivirga pacifica]SEW26434.1 hypothetical protein SAMN05216290_2340 [Roseivirga pacifica]
MKTQNFFFSASRFSMAVAFILFSSTVLWSQTYSGYGTGTNLDRYTINSDNSNNISNLRMQTGSTAFSIYNDGPILNFAYDPSSNHSAFGTYGIMTLTSYPTLRVGIGTYTPQAKLHVKVLDDQDGIVITRPGVNYAGGLYFNYSDGGDFTAGIQADRDLGGTNNGGLQLMAANARPIQFFTKGVNSGTLLSNTQEVMRINGNGKVGIGTSNPEKKLHVMGGIIAESNGVKVANGSAVSGGAFIGALNDKTNIAAGGYVKMTIATNGNVGIGDLNPQEKLAVAGSLKANTMKLGTDVLVNGTVLTVDGAVHISPENTTPIPFNTGEYLSEYLLWVEKGVVSVDYAISDPDAWDDTPDYVFEEDYQLSSLIELKQYVAEHKHLPGIPGIAELKKKNHYQIHDMLMGQLKNIEELVLHTIEQEEQLETQNEEIQELKSRLEALEALVKRTK